MSEEHLHDLGRWQFFRLQRLRSRGAFFGRRRVLSSLPVVYGLQRYHPRVRLLEFLRHGKGRYLHVQGRGNSDGHDLSAVREGKVEVQRGEIVLHATVEAMHVFGTSF